MLGAIPILRPDASRWRHAQRGQLGIRFSIIVPTFRRKESVRACLLGIASLDYPKSAFEVIIVDDGSPEPPRDEVRAYEGTLTIQLLIASPNAGPAKARNAGAAVAKGEYLLLMDDDCVPDPDWLRRMDERLHQFPKAMVGGMLRNGAPESICAEAGQQLVDFLYHYYNGDIDNARWFMSANIACPRAEFLAIGGFGTDFPLAAAEDRDLCDRWREAGHRLVLAPKAMVSHVRPMTLSTFWQQHQTYGRGAHHLHQARVRRRVGLPRMEPLRFYFRLLLSPFTDGKGWRAPYLLFLLFVSQVGYASGYYPERRRVPLPQPDRVGDDVDAATQSLPNSAPTSRGGSARGEGDPVYDGATE